MNLIQISERLKEAPDNLLMKEVQAPTGQYPAYLIISEMARRKKLRESGGQKPQAPQTTVAEDMAQEGGLAATPQAMASTAGMDMQGEEEPVEMAQGGLVAFQRGMLVDNEGIFPGMSFPTEGRNLGRPDSFYEDIARSRAEEERLSRMPTEEEQAATFAGGEQRFMEKVPFRRQEQQDRITKQERALEGERASNVNMALMEAGLGMMASRAPRGIQGVAEGGLKGLSALRAGKQEIKKSEAYLDQSKDNFARAQELYDAGKYAAGEKALEKAEMQRMRGLEAARAFTQGAYRQREFERTEQMFPAQLETQQRNLQFLRDTYDAKVAEAKLLPRSREAQIAKDNAAANLANAEAAFGGRSGRGAQPKPMTGTSAKGAFEGADSLVTSAQSSGYQIIGVDGRPVTGDLKQRTAQISSMFSRGLVANHITDPVSKKIILVPFGMQPQAMTPAPQGQGAAPNVLRFDANGNLVR
jgi:hypothetical protein